MKKPEPIPKFSVGDEVGYSNEALGGGLLNVKYPNRVGIVQSLKQNPPHAYRGGFVCRVLWEGRTSPDEYHEDFLTLKPKPKEAATP